MAEITAGGDINKGDLINKGKYPVIANGLNNNGIVGYSNKYKIDAPAVTITGRGTLGVATARFINFTPIVRLISIKSYLDPIYLENVINNTHFVIESTGVPQLTAPQVKRQTVILSNCHIEQTKIGSLLSTLDNTITLHEEKRLQLERFKRALLQRMFAYKIRYPKLRFNRFSDKWITINLGNILIQSIQKNKGYSYPVFTSSRQGLVRQIEHFGSNQQHDTADYNVIFPNQITYRNRSDDGQFTFNVNKLGSVGLVSKFYPVFVLKDFDNDFVVNDLNNNAKVKYDLSVLSVGTGQHVLSFANLCKYSIIAPDNHEQQKIGQLFSHLDVSLALCDMKIKRLKKLKHGLLQKMFV